MAEREVIEHYEKNNGWYCAKDFQEMYGLKNVSKNLISLEKRGYLESRYETIPKVGRKRMFRKIPKEYKNYLNNKIK